MPRQAYLMVDIASPQLQAHELTRLEDPRVAGVLLFARNYETPVQLQSTIQQIKSVDPNLLIAVDQEGGRIQRFLTGFTRLPAMGTLGKYYEVKPKKAIELATATGQVLAAELRNLGVDLSFTPMLDLLLNDNPVIGDRSFHRDPQVVFTLAHALIQGIHSMGMPVVGKHFPGHGGAIADSHHEVAIDTRTLELLQTQDLVPYQKLIRENRLDGVMLSHVCFPNIDPNPTGYSPYWINTVLRKAMNFNGLVVSDCLSMEAAANGKSPLERLLATWEAGTDLAIFTNIGTEIDTLIHELPLYDFCLEAKQRLKNFSTRIRSVKLDPHAFAKSKHLILAIDATEERL